MSDLRSRIDELQEELGKAESELADARVQLETVEEERKALLLREAQAQKDPAPLDNAAAPPPEGETEWRRVGEVTKGRATQPNVHPELSGQIGTALDLLRTLCGQLPAPAAATVGPATATAAPQPQPPHDGGKDAAVDADKKWRKEVTAQIKHGVNRAAKAKAAAAPAVQEAAMLPTPLAPASAPAEGAQQAASAAAAEQTGPAGGAGAADATSQWLANASPAELAKHYNNSDFEDLDGASECADAAEEDTEFIDAALAGATPEQRGRLRDILDKRRVRIAQRRRGPKRLKKAGKLREAVAGEDETRKKPAKA